MNDLCRDGSGYGTEFVEICDNGVVVNRDADGDGYCDFDFNGDGVIDDAFPNDASEWLDTCLLYTSPSPRD